MTIEALYRRAQTVVLAYPTSHEEILNAGKTSHPQPDGDDGTTHRESDPAIELCGCALCRLQD